MIFKLKVNANKVGAEWIDFFEVTDFLDQEEIEGKSPEQIREMLQEDEDGYVQEQAEQMCGMDWTVEVLP